MGKVLISGATGWLGRETIRKVVSGSFKEIDSSNLILQSSKNRLVDFGNGYKFPKIGKKMDYAEMYEWSIMTNFINSYEAKTFPYTNEITIESCNEIVKFKV